MQTATCPECGEGIGGGSHRLLDSNTRSEEFETILRSNGARRGYVDEMNA